MREWRLDRRNTKEEMKFSIGKRERSMGVAFSIILFIVFVSVVEF